MHYQSHLSPRWFTHPSSSVFQLSLILLPPFADFPFLPLPRLRKEMQITPLSLLRSALPVPLILGQPTHPPGRNMLLPQRMYSVAVLLHLSIVPFRRCEVQSFFSPQHLAWCLAGKGQSSPIGRDVIFLNVPNACMDACVGG